MRRASQLARSSTFGGVEQTIMYYPFFASMLLLMPSAIMADTLVAGSARDIHRGGYGGFVEYHAQSSEMTNAPFSIGWAAALHNEADDDLWGGIGISGSYTNRIGLFVSASFMPGYYSAGATDLGGNLQFRTVVSVGYNFSDKYALSLGLAHWSNGSIEAWNPGTDMIMLRLENRY